MAIDDNLVTNLFTDMMVLLDTKLYDKYKFKKKQNSKPGPHAH